MSFLEVQVHCDNTEEYDKLMLFVSSLGENFLGLEEFSLDEANSDLILGDRSYSGGNLPIEVITEVEDSDLARSQDLKFYFKPEIQEIVHKFFTDHCFQAKFSLVKSQDWNEEWRKHFKVIEIGNNLKVVPSWEKNEYLNDKSTIFIYPGMGFGSGSHETTSMCLELLCDLKTSPSEILDFGSGSGILGIAALKKIEHSTCTMVDIDEEAHQNAMMNLNENEIDFKKVQLLFPDDILLVDRQFDLIFANILKNILIEESERLVTALKPGGTLILSGLLREQEKMVLDHYLAKENIFLEKRISKNDWAAISLVKK